MNNQIEVTEDKEKKANISGRVEVQYKENFGTICDDSFDEKDATVLCRMLGYPVG